MKDAPLRQEDSMYQPEFVKGIGYCTTKCTEHDGSRCGRLGSHAPTDHVCSPWARDLVTRIHAGDTGAVEREPEPDGLLTLYGLLKLQKDRIVDIAGGKFEDYGVSMLESEQLLGDSILVASRIAVGIEEAKLHQARAAAAEAGARALTQTSQCAADAMAAIGGEE